MDALVIGLGGMGKRYLTILKRLSIKVVGVCDRRAEVLRQVAEEHCLAADCLSEIPEKTFSGPPADLVIVATTAAAHAPLTCLAAEAGTKLILCEKPMATSLEDCNRMIEACRRFGARLAINHQMRFMAQYTEPKRICASEVIGGLSSVTVVAGNIGMAMNGTHYFEMFRYMTDEPPVSVSAWFSEGRVGNPRGLEFEDKGGAIRVETPSGKRMYMDIGTDQGHGVMVVYAGRQGRIVVDELAGTMQVTAREETYRDLPTTRYGMPATTTMTAIPPADTLGPTQSVLEALIQGENYPTGEDGKRAVSAIVAAYVSNEEKHRRVGVDENLPRERVFPWA